MPFHLRVPLTQEDQATLRRWRRNVIGFYAVLGAILLAITIPHSYRVADNHRQMAGQPRGADCAAYDHLRSKQDVAATSRNQSQPCIESSSAEITALFPGGARN